jgi:hypothetical protein
VFGELNVLILDETAEEVAMEGINVVTFGASVAIIEIRHVDSIRAWRLERKGWKLINKGGRKGNLVLGSL